VAHLRPLRGTTCECRRRMRSEIRSVYRAVSFGSTLMASSIHNPSSNYLCLGSTGFQKLLAQFAIGVREKVCSPAEPRARIFYLATRTLKPKSGSWLPEADETILVPRNQFSQNAHCRQLLMPLFHSGNNSLAHYHHLNIALE